MSPKKPQSGQLFAHPFIEKLTCTNAVFAIGTYYALAAGALALGLWRQGLAALAVLPLGALAFSLLEYVVHRWLYHIAGESQAIQRFQYTVHGVHHQYPNDAERQVLPLILSVPLLGLFMALFWWVLGQVAWAAYAGFVAGYASYLLVHYSIHTRRPPRGWRRFWWKYHAVHHHQEPDRAFGVSSPLWDVIFGTFPRGNYSW